MMSEKRQGEIALKILKYQMAKKGLQCENVQREFGNLAVEIDVPRDELNQLLIAILPDLIGKMFGPDVRGISLNVEIE